MSYTPGQVPDDADKVPQFLNSELQSLKQAFTSAQDFAYLKTLNVAPTKPREGMLAKADGTNWNPGSGAGLYVYQSGAWVFVSGTVTHAGGALTATHVLVGNGGNDAKADPTTFIDASGNLGIGQTSPFSTTKFWIHHATDRNLAAYYNGGENMFGAFTDAGYPKKLRLIGSSVVLARDTAGVVDDVTLDASGKVGIGMTPNAQLAVAGGATIATLTDWNTKANSSFALNNPAVRFGIGYTAADLVELQAFDTVNAARDIVLQRFGGNVGIGGSPTASGGVLQVATPQGLGYGTGAGGTVTQITSKATSVTLNKPCGQIVMNNAALAATTTVQFQFSNSLLAATDCMVVNINGGVTNGGNYNVWVAVTGAGQSFVEVRNISAGSLSEAVVLNFAIIKAVTA